MMKLKYLFDNRDVVPMLLGYWYPNVTSLELLEGFRISANAVYPFSVHGNVFYLRFAPVVEKTGINIRAELDFLYFLQSRHYPAVKVVSACDGRELITAETPWGQMVAVVFESVKGEPLSQIEYENSLYYGYGKSLGQLHTLSMEYHTKGIARGSWQDVLVWCEQIILEYGGGETALSEAHILREYFAELPDGKEVFGLIHYDFELDNVFYDKDTGVFCPIDFDDSVYHWFVMDIEQALSSIRDELPDELFQRAAEQFMHGYSNEKSVDASLLACLPMFRRYANLLTYARVLRSMHEKWENEPNWMTEIRQKLTFALEDNSKFFGQSVTSPLHQECSFKTQ